MQVFYQIGYEQNKTLNKNEILFSQRNNSMNLTTATSRENMHVQRASFVSEIISILGNELDD